MKTPSVIAILLLGAISFTACDRPPAPVGVQGRVTFDAQPIPEGQIEFEPVPGSPAQRRDAEIRNGQFKLPDGEGLAPGGEFRVLVKAFRKTGRRFPGKNGMSPFDEYEQYLPENFNSTSDLRIKINRDEQQNQFDFQLDSQTRTFTSLP